MDESGVLREFNPAAERIFGHARAAVVGRPLGDVLVPPHLRRAHAGGLARLLATGQSRMVGRRIETEGLRADGSLFPIELAIVELRLEGRRLFAAYLRDLTDRQQAEAEILRQREALHQSEKMAALGSLLAGVAHELNNPLSVVVGRALMIEEAVRAPAIADSARRLRAAAERCGRIVRTFLAMARQSDGTRQPVALPPLVDAALELLSYRLDTAGIAVERQLDERLPPVWGDPDRLHQVILNLLVNAQQALADVPAPRRLWISMAAAEDGIRLVVADSGPGVPAELRRRVFDPFFTTKPPGGGTGIGLSFCQGIVAALGGGITVDERPGGGARFTVRLPAGEGHAVPAERVADGGPEPVPARILVVDDEAEIALMLQEALQREGHEVVTAGNGREARARLAEGRFDLILSDIRMAESDGPDLYRFVCRDHPELADRFLMMTGDTLGPALQLLPPAMQRQRIEKPIDLASLRLLMAQRLAQAPSAR
jgi:two-component system NtrC family sensor kinase